LRGGRRRDSKRDPRGGQGNQNFTHRCSPSSG
jgi:hypothetical protein